MKRRRWVFLWLAFCLWWPRAAALQEPPATLFYRLLSDVRLQQGLLPLAQSTLLTQAAQRHADDIATRGTATHEGADGSNYRQRIREAGYRAWNDGLLAGETFWMGLGTAEDAIAWFRNNPEYWQHLVDPRYREIGIGYAADAQGVHYFVINLGARPGVLPIFINEGAAATDSPQVAVRLTNEEAEPLGEGAWMGKAIEVRLSSSPDFGDIPWMPWEPLLPWLLPTTPGEYAVYAQYRDGANRTAVAEATIRLVAEGEVILPPPRRDDLPPELPAIPTPDAWPEAEATPTPALSFSPETPEVFPTAFLPDSPPPEVYPTWTPLPLPTTTPATAAPTDWPLLATLLLQGFAVLLGIAVFLRRR